MKNSSLNIPEPAALNQHQLTWKKGQEHIRVQAFDGPTLFASVFCTLENELVLYLANLSYGPFRTIHPTVDCAMAACAQIFRKFHELRYRYRIEEGIDRTVKELAGVRS